MVQKGPSSIFLFLCCFSHLIIWFLLLPWLIGEKNHSSRLLAVENRWLFLLKPTVGRMKGHLLVSHYILEHSAQTKVFGSAGPVIGVNENSILSVSQQNFQEKGGNLYLRAVALVTRTPFLSFLFYWLQQTLKQHTVFCENRYPQCQHVV